MKKEKIMLRVLVVWLIFSILLFNGGTIVLIIDLLQYSLPTTLPLIIIIVALTVLLDVALTLMLIETKEEWK